MSTCENVRHDFGVVVQTVAVLIGGVLLLVIVIGLVAFLTFNTPGVL